MRVYLIEYFHHLEISNYKTFLMTISLGISHKKYEISIKKYGLNNNDVFGHINPIR